MEFKCRVDRRQFVVPIVMWCVFDIIILIGAPSLFWGVFGVIFTLPPVAVVLFLGHRLWSRVAYTVDGTTLLVSSPMKSLTINIESIKKIRRGKFWVDRGHNYSASRVKLRIVYDRSSYIYVSPDREDLFITTLRSINPSIAFTSERI